MREASTLFSFGHAAAYEHENDVTYLEGVRLADMGDANIVHTDTLTSHANIRRGIEATLNAGALPVTTRGDHSDIIPCFEAHEGRAPFHILQIDAHLDFVDERHDITRTLPIVGVDLVEVAPDYDPTGSAAILAAQLLMNLLGFVFHAGLSRA